MAIVQGRQHCSVCNSRQYDRVKQLRAAGEDIIGLATGTPDFDTPAYIKAAGKAAIDEDRTYITYTQSAGLPELREAIAAKLARENNVQRDRG